MLVILSLIMYVLLTQFDVIFKIHADKEPVQPSAHNKPALLVMPHNAEYEELSQLIKKFNKEQRLEQLEAINKEIKLKLKIIPLAQRYQLYTQLKNALLNYIEQLNNAQQPLLEKYGNVVSGTYDAVYAEEQTPEEETLNDQQREQLQEQLRDKRYRELLPLFIAQQLSKDEQQLLQQLKQQYIDILDRGEGYYDFRVNPYYWQEYFAPQMTAADQQFFKLKAQQNQTQYFYDAGIAIDWHTLGERAYSWEAYLEHYPNSFFKADAQQFYHMYLNDFLLGMDNTPTCCEAEGQIIDYAQQGFDEISKKYPSSVLAAKVKQYQQLIQHLPPEAENDRYQYLRKSLHLQESPDQFFMMY